VPTPAQGNDNRRRVTLVTYLDFLALGLFTAVIGVAWPYIRETFNQPLDAFGWLLGAGTTGTLIASSMSGRIVGRFGVGRFLLGSNLLAAAGAVGVALAPGWWVLVAFYLTMGAGTGAIHAGLNNAMTLRFGPRHVSWLHVMFALGATIGPTLLTRYLLAGNSWPGWYLIAAFALVFHALLFALSARWWPPVPAPETDVTQSGGPDLRETLRQPVVLLSIILFFLYTGIESTAGQWAFSLFTEGRNIPPGLAGLAISLYWGALTAGRIVLGFAGERWATPRLVSWCLIFAFLGAGLFTLARAEPTLSVIALCLIGLALSPLYPQLMANTAARVRPRFAGNAIGFQVSAGSVGVAALPAGAGVLADAVGLEVIGPFLLVAIAVKALVYWRLQSPARGRVR
jgi:fucose permease